MAYRAGFRKISVDVPVASTREQVTVERIWVPWFEIFAPSANTGNVYIGDVTVDSTWIPRIPGSYYRFTFDHSDFMHGDLYDLSKLYVFAGTGGDDLIVQYPWIDE